MNAPTRILPPAGARALREARSVPSSYNEADRSFEVVWSTGAAVTRFDWMDGGFYDETLSLAPGAVRLDRLNEGAPLLDSHNDRQLASLVGSVVPGSVRLAGGQGLARVRLAEGADVDTIAAKIRDGHLRKVSVGYQVHAYERIERDGERPELRAVDWEPVEISLVAVPADPGALIRSRGSDMNAVMGAVRQPDESDIVSAKFVREKCRNLGLSDKETLDLVAQYTDEPTTRSDFLSGIIEYVSERQSGGSRAQEYFERHRLDPIDNAITSTFPRDQRAAHLQHPSGQHPLATRMQGALYARLAGKAPSDESREFSGASMIDMARGLLELGGERGIRYASPSRVWDLTKRSGALTTSDFPAIMAGAINQFLTERYASSPAPLAVIAKSREVNDFREIKALWVDGNPTLDLVVENGEYTYGSLIEGTESYKLATFGKILSLTRQLIINDNLGALAEIGSWYVREGGRKRSDILSAVVRTGVMADGKTIFHADHGNLAPVGTALSVASLSAGRQAMRLQKDRDGVTVLGIAPKYLIVGPLNETTAEQVLTELAAATTADVNPFPGKLTLVIEPSINDYSWYLFADPNQAPVLEYATLRGQGDSIFVDTRIGFEIDAVEHKARIDFGAGAVDYRGGYKNPGAAPA
jgi:phage head maturation protease